MTLNPGATWIQRNERAEVIIDKNRRIYMDNKLLIRKALDAQEKPMYPILTFM